MKIIVGLGNLDKEYDGTRHNVGFKFVEGFARKNGIDILKKKTKYIYGEGTVNGEKTVIIQPSTYMNLSGEAIVAAKKWYKVGTDDIIVIYDDVDLPLGEARYREVGSAGTHNGMRNIVWLLKTENIKRIRIGIENRENDNIELVNYVLGKFSKEENEVLEKNSFPKAEQYLYDFLK